MKINKNSWHYRLVRLWSYGKKVNHKSLCTYFWNVLFCSLFSGLFLVCLTVYISLALLPVSYVIPIELNEQLDSLRSSIFYFELIVLTLTGLVLFFTKTNSGSLLLNFIKAKIDKVCPKIEFYKPRKRKRKS